MKRVVSLLFLLLTGAASAQAQMTAPAAATTNTAPPDLVVLQKKWQSFSRNPALDQDPFDANDDFADTQRAQRVNDQMNKMRGRGAEALEPPPPSTKRNKDTPHSEVIKTYVYRAKVKNTGAKTICVIDWGYNFLDPDTQQELGQHLYTTKVKIRPGHEDELVGRSAKPQTATISAKSAGKELGEQVVIYRVEYEDGSVWQPPPQQ
ncbi:MAG: hypothetical protein JOZ96_21950 [Acidobacteria bacterium]|nr:hypothetical protein [Acidobacteriota bacterium]